MAQYGSIILDENNPDVEGQAVDVPNVQIVTKNGEPDYRFSTMRHDDDDTRRIYRKRRIALASAFTISLLSVAAIWTGGERGGGSYPSRNDNKKTTGFIGISGDKADADDNNGALPDPSTLKELRQPEVRRSENGLLETTFQITPAHITDGPVSYMTRTYEGTVPGPTLMLKSGDTLKIKQINRLGPEPKDYQTVENSLQLPNTTTIHTHGLHISPSGVADNIFRVLESGGELDAVYPLRSDHQPGTFFYHPHYHGSSTLQMLGGMSGALIVEDDSSTLPPALKDAKDLVLMLQHVNVESGTFRNYLYASDQVYHSLLNPAIVYTYKEAPGNYFIVNGQYQPKITLKPKEWVRLRLINAGVNDYLILQLPGCKVYEIAADGVFYSAPRNRSQIVLVPGGRKDLFVQCPASTEGGGGVSLYKMSSEKDDKLMKSYFGRGTDVFDGTLFYINIEGEDAATSSSTLPTSLPAPDPSKQPQFTDLRQVGLSDEAKFDYVFTTNPKVERNGVMYSNFGVNNKTLHLTEVQRRVKLGQVEEWNLTQVDYNKQGEVTTSVVNHPFHLHVNHFQITSMMEGGEGIDYQIGDWRDSISLPAPAKGVGFTTIRWKADDYTGMAPAHCHIFAHSDTGMTMTFEVYDDEKKEGDKQGEAAAPSP